MKKCFNISLDIKEMQGKSTLRFHLTPVRMAVIKKIMANAGEDEREWGGGGCWWECKLVQLLWKSYGGFSEN
jgi:hypothetical protein